MTYLFGRKGEDAADFIVFWRDPVCCDESPCGRGGDHYEEMAVERSRVEALFASMIQEGQVSLKDADD